MSEIRNADLSALRIQRSPQQQSQNTRSSFPWKVVITIVVVILVLGGAWSMFKSSLAASPEVDIATANMVSASQSNSVLTASGYVVAQVKAAVSSKVAGRLVQLNVIEGDEVKRNQVLGRIESADVEATLSQLRAALDMAKADLGAAQAELDDASIDFTRRQSLLTSGASTQMEMDIAKARKRRAEASLAARSAAIKMAEANVRNAEVQIENTILRAPFDGTVLTKNANVGEVITALGAAAGSRGAVVTVADMNSLEVEADVSESNIERIQTSQPCEIILDAYPEKRYRASISKIIPTADRAKATVLVKIRFEERDARVLPEMGAKVYFLKPDTKQSDADAVAKLMIPSSAVHARDAKQWVFVYSGDQAKEIAVRLGRSSNNLTEVLEGLSAGDKVIVSPPETLKDGMKVQLRK